MSNYLKQTIRPYVGSVVILCVLTVLTALLQVASTLFMRDVVDAALTDPSRLMTAGALLLGNLLLLVAVHGLSRWISGSASDRCIAGMRRNLLRSIALSEDTTRYDHHSGSLLSRAMDDVRTFCDGAIHALPSLVGQIARLITSFAAVLLLYPRVACYVAVAAVIAVAVAAVLRPLLKKHHKQVRRADEQMLACMQEDLRHMELVKSLQAEEQMLSRFGEKVKASLSAKRDRRFVSVSIDTMISGVSDLATVVTLLWGASQVSQQLMTYGSLTAMLQLLSLLRSPVLGLSGLWTRLTSVEVAAERLQGLMTVQKPEAPAAVATVQAVVFDHVTFSYPGDDEPVLVDFSAEFSLDRWMCLTGASGRGKSTIFKLMLGLYYPQQGQVCLRTEKGIIPCGPQTRGFFAYVSQDYPLFSGSVMDNLLLAAPESGEDQRRSALRLACADFIFDLPEGEHTQLRENNDGLSKGQLQRIAVARAALMQRQILLMDECSSALDAQTEKTMLSNLHKLGTKAVLVTHRPEALHGLDAVDFVDMERM